MLIQYIIPRLNFSTTTEPQQMASADDGTSQLVGNGFSNTADMVEEYEAPTGLGSFGPTYGFGNDAANGAKADKPSATVESHLLPPAALLTVLRKRNTTETDPLKWSKLSLKHQKKENIVAFRH